jgi:hypothetical protein
LYLDGNGVQQDYAKALFWLQKAGEKGVDGAQFNLGLMYYDGLGVAKDRSKAAFWYRKAADQGSVDAQYNLALQLMNGWGVPQSMTEAVIHFQKAAEKGDSNRNTCLGSFTRMVAWVHSSVSPMEALGPFPRMVMLRSQETSDKLRNGIAGQPMTEMRLRRIT